MEMTPLLSEFVRIKSATSKLFSPKNVSAPCCCNSITFRRIVPVEAVETFPYSFSISSFPSAVMYCNTFVKSFKSKSGRLLSSQYLKIKETIPPCVSFNPNIFESNTGPNSLTVARSLTPGFELNVNNSTGYDCGLYSSPSDVERSFNLSLSEPGAASPLKSPFISNNKTGTPASLNPSLIVCNVFVFPVPVAPAINP